MIAVADKHHTTGAHRTVPPEETLERVRPFLRAMGITRVADVTGLDTIGVPVVMVSRPNARSLSVSQGKGLTLAAAQASGVMESVEHFHAEHIELPVKLLTFEELSRSHRVVDVTTLPRLSVGAFRRGLRTLWIEGRSLESGLSTWVPYEMAHTNYALPLPPGSGSFLMSSNGLASGNHPLEAVSHGISELIERDASTLFHLSDEAFQRSRRVDLSTVDDPACRRILDLYAEASVDVFVWETTSDVEVPCFWCDIVDSEPHLGRPIGPMSGMGCHPSRAVALLRALTEAAQSRLTMIAGVRDDVTYRSRGPEAVVEIATAHRDRRRAEAPKRSFHEAPSFESQRLSEDVRHLRERLSAVGIPEVVVVDLTRQDFGIPVVRVLVPGLEPLFDVPGYVAGARARRRLSLRAV